MNVASLELSKTLHELSGWTDTYKYWAHIHNRIGEYINTAPTDEPFESIAPAYDLGYLLRKLYELKRNLRIEHNHGDMHWYAYYSGRNEFTVDVGAMPNADTPEDAACKLAIELFKQGVLTK